MGWYPEPAQLGSQTNEASLYPTPGVVEIGNVTSLGFTGQGLAHFTQDGREFAVIGSIFYEIFASGTPINWGLVSISPVTPATISSNGKAGGQLLITVGSNAFIFTLATNALVQVVALNGKATMGDQLDGYFLVLDATTSTWYFSALLDGLTWNTGLNFIKRSAAADSWVALKVVNKYIWLFGTQTSEIWYDAGTFPTPFAPYPTTLVPYGCAAPFSPVVANGTVIWVGQSASGQSFILQAAGFTPTVISTYALSVRLNSFSSVADAIGDAYTSLGHTFYILSFATALATICYDANTQLWHDRGTWSPAANIYTDWRPRFHAFVFGQHRMLDARNGAIYHMDESFFSDVEGRAIRRLRRSPTMFKENFQIGIDAFQVDMEIGLGNTVDPGSNPQVMLRQSYDGGKTWGAEHWKSAGKIGEYKTRVIWNRLGRGRRRCFEVVVTDGVPWRLLGASVEIRESPHGIKSARQQAQAG
jgi:hypothetical protein